MAWGSKPAMAKPAATPSSPHVLVLQGGGALGAYQAGMYAEMHREGLEPDWVAGISIGAINAALIAGNAPEHRLPRLRAFWDRVSSELLALPPVADGPARRWFNELAANTVAVIGAPGFFRPHNWFNPKQQAMHSAISMYDTAPLRETLLELVDFDRLNASPMRVSLGAVNVLTGNFRWFDSTKERLGPEHIMASGALPPGFPPVMIEGEPYWDGGLVSNTPLQYVLDEADRCDMTIYQVDLFHARGAMPQDISEVLQREKDIRYSSRTRFNTDGAQQLEALRLAACRLAEKLPKALREDPDIQALTAIAGPGAIRIMLLINRREEHESYSKDYEFSRASVNEHWDTGAADMRHSLTHKMWAGRDTQARGIITYDCTNPEGARMRGADGVEMFEG